MYAYDVRISEVSSGCVLPIFVFKQKTAYDVRISDWSSDVCSSDLTSSTGIRNGVSFGRSGCGMERSTSAISFRIASWPSSLLLSSRAASAEPRTTGISSPGKSYFDGSRSEEHTSELQSLMRNSYAVFCLQKKSRNRRRIKAKPTDKKFKQGRKHTHSNQDKHR